MPPAIQNWMRDYDPTTGRYIRTDPLGLVDGACVYGHARQSPMAYTDPTGQCPFCAAAAAGAISGAVMDLLLQFMLNDWEFGCVNWGQVGLSGTAGAFGGAAASAGYKGAWSLKKYSEACSRTKFRKVNKITGRGTEVHHSFFGASRNGGNRTASWTNSWWNYKPLPADVHRSVHGAGGGYGPVRQWWHGTPGWAKWAEGAAYSGGIAEWLDDDTCGCTNWHFRLRLNSRTGSRVAMDQACPRRFRYFPSLSTKSF